MSLADLSIIEWIAYGIPAYGSLFMLIISMIRDVPATRALSAVRLFMCIPGMIAAAMLAPAGPKISGMITQTNSTIVSLNTTDVFNETATTATYYVLSGSVWYYFHWMIFIILFVYLVYQILLLLIKPE